jgi:hypothetical protein
VTSDQMLVRFVISLGNKGPLLSAWFRPTFLSGLRECVVQLDE